MDGGGKMEHRQGKLLQLRILGIGGEESCVGLKTLGTVI